jgi:hypothetical protein
MLGFINAFQCVAFSAFVSVSAMQRNSIIVCGGAVLSSFRGVKKVVYRDFRKLDTNLDSETESDKHQYEEKRESKVDAPVYSDTERNMCHCKEKNSEIKLDSHLNSENKMHSDTERIFDVIFLLYGPAFR